MNPSDLQRFVEAQSGIYPQVLDELAAGYKRSHWMWFIFPQIAGLGSSVMARRFAIGSRQEAEAYLAHDVLGIRLMHCVRLLVAKSGKPIGSILGSPDDMKFRSSMTLFDAVSPDGLFQEAIEVFYADGKDAATLEILRRLGGS